MALLSPIATLVAVGAAVPGQLTLYPTVDTYDPGSTVDFAEAGSSTLDVMGVITHADTLGIQLLFDAIYLISLNYRPDGLIPDKARCTVGGERYMVKAVQERYYMGQRDGFALQLGQ